MPSCCRHMLLIGLVYKGIGLSLTADEMGTDSAWNGNPWVSIPTASGIAYEIDGDMLEEIRLKDLLAVS